MSQNPNTTIAVVGIDIGKNAFHIVGLDSRGEPLAKWSRGQVEYDCKYVAAPDRHGAFVVPIISVAGLRHLVMMPD